jgi:hypothetical protein
METIIGRFPHGAQLAKRRQLAREVQNVRGDSSARVGAKLNSDAFGDGQGDMSLDRSIILRGHKDVKGELSRPLRLAAQPSR